MNTAETALWEKINRFQFNEPGIDFSFEERLARENGWTKEYTHRVIDEYKKFIFLCRTSETGITPSDPVDQAWHLHLTFTKSYWVDLCKNTLEKEIHHNPTKGGQKEAEKFNNYYSFLFELYQQKFNSHPPADIWHNHKKRFSYIDFQRVNLQRYWLVKKPAYFFKKMLILVGIGLFALLFIQASNTTYIWGIIITIIVVIVFLATNKRNNRNKNGRSAGGSGCGSGCAAGMHGDSGCGGGSGCSGGGGCSGCGGGGD